jgi:hypothetical protein
MIDCSRTKNYFAEKQRMTGQRKDGVCELNCIDCPLSSFNNGIGIPCMNLESSYPEKAIAIIQKWSDEHPQKTYLSEFLKNHPNILLNDDGTPTFCPYELSLISVDNCRNDGDCVKCWNQPIEGGEE